MRLPVHTIHFLQRCCQEDTDKILSFMENKTEEELRSHHSIRVLEDLRNNLRLHINRMNLTWRDHSPGDGNVDTAAFTRLNTIVESTRVDVGHVLRESGGEISHRVLWTPDMPDPFDPDIYPEPYTSLRQFHRPVMPIAHSDSPHAQRPTYPGSVAGRASHMSYTNTLDSG